MSTPPRSRVAASLLLLVAPVVALAACNGSSGGGAPPGNPGGAPGPVNLGLAATSVLGDGALALVRVSEPDQGDQDLNGDGDANDLVAWAYDMELGTSTDLSLALSSAPDALDVVRGSLALLAVPEAQQGGRDLNGDGDALDVVAHVFDLRTGATTNLGLALGPIPPVLSDDFVAFTVSEADQGATDLDGDGALGDAVLHVYDARTGQTKNVARNVTLSLLAHDGRFGFTTDERPRLDLNGDGDALDDYVPEFYDPLQQTLVALPLALLPGSLFAGDSNVASDEWIALVDEAGQGGADLNGDGDPFDGVYHSLAPDSGTWTTLRLSASGPSLAPYSTLVAARRAALIAAEIDGFDHNRNAILDDLRLVLDDLDHGIHFETKLLVDPLGGESALALGGGVLALQVSESLQNEDLDGDGLDPLDRVVELVDLQTGVVKNLGLDSRKLWASDAAVLFTRDERGADLNADGDRDDTLLFVLPAGGSAVRNTKLAAEVLDLAGSFALLHASEPASHVDLDDDGDELDELVLRYRPSDGEIQVFAPWSADGLTRFGGDGRILHLADESQLAQDLNADGDQLDLVFEVSPLVTTGD